jgi:hypothetical protein
MDTHAATPEVTSNPTTSGATSAASKSPWPPPPPTTPPPPDVESPTPRAAPKKPPPPMRFRMTTDQETTTTTTIVTDEETQTVPWLDEMDGLERMHYTLIGLHHEVGDNRHAIDACSRSVQELRATMYSQERAIVNNLEWREWTLIEEVRRNTEELKRNTEKCNENIRHTQELANMLFQKEQVMKTYLGAALTALNTEPTTEEGHSRPAGLTRTLTLNASLEAGDQVNDPSLSSMG